jgi:phosphoglycolate phosphatase
MNVILFDIDGTLIDAGKAAKRAFHKAFQDVFQVAPVVEGVTTHGATDSQIRKNIALATFKRDLSPSEYTKLNSRYIELLYAEIEVEPEYRVLPGVGQLLKYLAGRDDVVVGLQTGNLVEAVPAKLGRGGLARYFRVGGYGTDSPIRAEIIRAALARVRETYTFAPSRPSQVAVIGDSPQDIKAAAEVGARAIGVTTGIYSLSELEAAGPCAVLQDLSQLDAVIPLLIGQSV